MGDYRHLEKEKKNNQARLLLKFLKLSCYPFKDPFIYPNTA